MLSFADRRLPTVLLASLAALSWLMLWALAQSSAAGYLDHSSLNHILLGHQTPVTLILPAFVWMLMTVAMMLPTALPLVGLFHAMVADRANAAALIVLLTAGYVAVWTAFGFLAHALIGLLQLAVAQLTLPENGQTIFRSGLLLIAGAYQFTPLKRHCLAKCRSPLSFILERRRGRGDAYEAFRIGWDHGIYCVGCCWSLMLLMFLIASAHLAWMLALGTVMAVEKNMPWGARLSTPLGVLLLVAGVVIWF
jgi:predicted metal-binding membrane protein